MQHPSESDIRVGLFVTCLVDLTRPSVGFASVELLRAAGCNVEVPEAHTCCGQPAYNSGDSDSARALAEQTIVAFEQYDYLVAPSGSCIATVRDYPALFSGEPQWQERASALAAKSYELTSFLVDVLHAETPAGHQVAKATYHDACSGLRELGIQAQPRQLLAAVEQLELVEMAEREVCCGFGGTFCVKYPEISTRMVDDKLAAIEATGADTLIGGDLGCLLNMEGRLKRLRRPIRVLHVAEVLASARRAREESQ